MYYVDLCAYDEYSSRHYIPDITWRCVKSTRLCHETLVCTVFLQWSSKLLQNSIHWDNDLFICFRSQLKNCDCVCTVNVNENRVLMATFDIWVTWREWTSQSWWIWKTLMEWKKKRQKAAKMAIWKQWQVSMEHTLCLASPPRHRSLDRYVKLWVAHAPGNAWNVFPATAG